MVAADLKRRALVPLFPAVKPATDHFRLVFRNDDSRRTAFEMLAAALRALPLR
jgi:hypothetical protein